MPVTAIPPVAHSMVNTLGSKRGAPVPEQSRTSGIGSVVVVVELVVAAMVVVLVEVVVALTAGRVVVEVVEDEDTAAT
jgi:hypothetical protein